MPLAAKEGGLGDRLTLVAGACIGGVFFFWIAGIRLLTPTEFGWVMQGDWRIHFLGWQFFRNEPWHWPPGRIDGYLHAPNGTALGFTDSLPLVALLLKPLSSVLPEIFQYLGLWLLLCFVLQGFFGVLIARVWTPHRWLQLLSAALFVLMPTLLIRVSHPALCAHWLLLWALWLYFRSKRGTAQAAVMQASLGLVAGLVHPYLAVMVLAILLALALKDVMSAGARLRAIGGLLAAVGGIGAGWWASGLFTISSAANLAAEGFGDFSMNLLAPITPSGRSTILPEIPTGAPGQRFEGFQYLGVGALLLVAVAIILAVRWFRALPWRDVWPVLLLTLLCALYALSPKVTFGSDVLVDVTTPESSQYASFRATGRFFWPMAYLLLSSAIAVAVTRLAWRFSFVLLLAAVILQCVDLNRVHTTFRMGTRGDAFHAHRLRLQSPVWPIALPHYKHMVLYLPPQCGPAPASFEWPALLASRHGLTINAGEVARDDPFKRASYCDALEKTLANGDVADDTIYLITPSHLERFRSRISIPMVCTELDRIPVCLTAGSFEAWRSQAPAAWH